MKRRWLEKAYKKASNLDDRQHLPDEVRRKLKPLPRLTWRERDATAQFIEARRESLEDGAEV